MIMSFKCKIVTGFLLYWVYQLYKTNKRQLPAEDRFRFPDFK